MAHIRPFRSGDESALADICLRTADAGHDATGILDDDRIWAEIFVLPYVARHPDLAFVVVSDDGRVVGYIVGTPDTDQFEEWFRTRWWPEREARWPAPATPPVAASAPAPAQSRQDGILTYAYARRPGAEPYAADYPAHLHIDLLPETQGAGWGRRLIDAFVAELQARGVAGVHLGADLGNAGALAFYPRVGFSPIPSHPGVQIFARSLS